MSNTDTIPFTTTLEAFLSSDEFPSWILASTKANWSDSYYTVELFPGGHYRVLWSNEIGNRYETPGILLRIPPLDDSDYQDFVEIAESMTSKGESEELALVKEIGWSDEAEITKEEMREALRETLIPLEDQ